MLTEALYPVAVSQCERCGAHEHCVEVIDDGERLLLCAVCIDEISCARCGAVGGPMEPAPRSRDNSTGYEDPEACVCAGGCRRPTPIAPVSAAAELCPF